MHESSGKFILEGVTAGRFQFQFHAPDFLDVQFEMDVTPGKVKENQV